ncbi:hypothetical protein DVB87_04955 [Tsukamurella tyrosinosolvens]|nr:hypothetical protein DVB87_04955 [Tsukamurella tyrosinosolvens]
MWSRFWCGGIQTPGRCLSAETHATVAPARTAATTAASAPGVSYQPRRITPSAVRRRSSSTSAASTPALTSCLRETTPPLTAASAAIRS